MPGTYPAGAPVLTGDSLAISRFLNSPESIKRRLRDFKDLRFVSDQILTQRFRSSGGAVLYEQTEPFVTDRTVEAVSAGSEYPFANMPTGTAALAAVSKWGQKVRITDEEVARNVYGQAAVDRALQKVINSIISQVDSITMSAIGTVPGDTATLGKWDAGSPKVLNDILNAKRIILARNLGYNPDTDRCVGPRLHVDDDRHGHREPVAAGRPPRTPSTPATWTGRRDEDHRHAEPAGAHEHASCSTARRWAAWPTRSTARPATPSPTSRSQVKSIRLDDIDAWDLQARRKTVPVVQEPGAGQEITGVTS
jgi:hypothetical protein